MAKIVRDDLGRYLRQSEVDTFSPQSSPVDFNVEVSYQNVILYKFEALYSHLLVQAPDEQKNELTQVLDKSGMYELEVEFNPASEANIEIKNSMVELQDGSNIPAKIRTSDPSFNMWFKQACSLLGDKVCLIPDTNVGRRLYYTNYLRNLLIGDTSHSMTITIPRLVMLEVEGMYNRNKPAENPPPPTVQQKDYDSYLQNEKRKAKERRIAFQTMGEILSMKNDGAKVLSSGDMTLVRSFASEAGKGNADAWIRKEIINSKPDLVRSIGVRPDMVETSNLAFLTCDLMNSLAAMAEDLNTIYFYRLEEKIQSIIIYYDKLASLIFNTAIHFEECDIDISGKEIKEQLKCKGVWSGKSAYDWQNGHIIVDRIAHT